MLLLPIAAAGIGAYALYSYWKGHHPVASAVANAPNPPPEAKNSFAGSSEGGIAYTPTSKLAGSGTDIRHIVAPPPTTPIAYAPATTVTDPNVMHQTVAAYQAAQPTPSGVYYYPADGDIWGLLLARLGGTPKARIVDAANNKNIPLSAVAMADLGKLNGFVSAKDFDNWIKAKKPLQLPANGWNDVSGPIPGAAGTIR